MRDARRSPRAVALAIVAASIACAALAAPPAEEAILKLEDLRIQAMIAGDVATLDRILAPELTYGHSNGRMDTKATFLAQITSGELKYKDVKREEVRVQVLGATAIVTGRADMEVHSPAGDLSLKLRFTDVYVERDGRWEMVAWQSARVP